MSDKQIKELFQKWFSEFLTLQDEETNERQWKKLITQMERKKGENDDESKKE